MANTSSFRAQWARRLVREKVAAELNKGLSVGNEWGLFGREDGQPVLGIAPTMPAVPFTPDHLPLDGRLRGSSAALSTSSVESMVTTFGATTLDASKVLPEKLPETPKLCIVGAGVAGLYIAMILDSLEIPGLTYEILEGSDRTGGRLNTHYFSDTPHDYYDIGAMRFPHLKIMKRTFDLFTRIDTPLIAYYLDPAQKEPYVKGSVKCPSRYNDIIAVDGDEHEPGEDVFHVGVANKGAVPDATIQKGVSGILNEAFGKYKNAMKEDFKTGYEMLLEVDKYSTRQYLSSDQMETQYDFFSIQWLETNNTSSGLFDQAFSESVIDSFDFEAPEGDGAVEEWSCIDGGTSLVTKGMEKAIKGSVKNGRRVTGFSVKHDSGKKISVHVAEEQKPRGPFDTVFNTTSLGCLQRMDLTELDLHPSQKDAIRCLHYDDSAKVAIKFSYPWWIKDCGISSGGVASTDIALRTCVYPSYNLDDGLEKPAVLLCSYTWSQDATRIGSLVKPDSPNGEDELRELMFNDLALLHLRNFNENQTGEEMSLDQVRERIAGAYITHHAFSYSHDPWTSGAFALFGPGQFANLYPYLIRPAADSRFHIVGEASSAHHAWIVGSLNSAYLAVRKFLNKFSAFEYIAKLEKLWDVVDEGDGGFDGTEHLQVMLGMQTKTEQMRV